MDKKIAQAKKVVSRPTAVKRINIYNSNVPPRVRNALVIHSGGNNENL